MVEEGYEFFAKRQLVTIFSAPNYCGEFENAGAMMSVDDTLMCSFQVGRQDMGQGPGAGAAAALGHAAAPPVGRAWIAAPLTGLAPALRRMAAPASDVVCCARPAQILKPAEKKQKAVYGGY